MMSEDNAVQVKICYNNVIKNEEEGEVFPLVEFCISNMAKGGDYLINLRMILMWMYWNTDV